ncbi:MAG: hypothetical protein ACYCUG_07785 [Acidimicrobiales bacterium]
MTSPGQPGSPAVRRSPTGTDRPWSPPTEHVVVERRWRYAPPPWVIHDAVVAESDRWLSLLPGEAEPEVASSRRPDWVLIRTWVDAAVRAIELHVEPDGPGSRMTVLAYGEAPALDEESRRRVRHRLGTAFGAALREWVDEPHL